MKRNIWSRTGAALTLALALLASAGCTGVAGSEIMENQVSAKTSSALENPAAGDAEAVVAEPAASKAQKTAAYRFGIGYSGTGYTKNMNLWRERVLERTGQDVELSLYGDNVLGSSGEMLQAVQNGTLSIVACSTSVCTSLVPEAAVLDIPACYGEYIRPFMVYEGPFFEELNQSFREQGLELLYLRTGEYWLISSERPLTSLEQLKGIRLRTSGSEFHNKLFDILGMTRVEDIGLNGLSYILDEDGVDGIETTYTILKSQELLEAQPYALKCPLFVMGSAIVMNAEAYRSLPSDYQTELKSAVRDILGSQQKVMRAENEAGQGEAGLTVYRLTEEEKETLRSLAQPVFEEIRSVVRPELLEALRRENGKRVP